MSGLLPITAAVITKNEEDAIVDCLRPLVEMFDQVLVIDSHSSDRTAERAETVGATVISFSWDGRYPKKKQWSLQCDSVVNDWVLLLDADERVSAELFVEIAENLGKWTGTQVAAVEARLEYYWLHQRLRHGYKVRKHILLNRNLAQFPTFDDLDAPGATEVEGHYQPELSGSLEVAKAKLIHDDPGSFGEWLNRHNKYSDWEAHLLVTNERRDNAAHRSKRGRIFYQAPFKPLAFFMYSYVLRLGFLDGRAGLTYALANAFYYWSISVKRREMCSRLSQIDPAWLGQPQ